MKEEVGLDIEITRLVGVFWKSKTSEVVFQFEGTTISGQPTTSEEADEVEYFELEELPENLSPSQRERIAHSVADHDRALLIIQDHRPARDLLRDGKL